MLVSEVKPIGKVGKNLLQDKNADEMIELIIEKPLQKTCKKCKQKNIETVMSSANKKNIVKPNMKKIAKSDVLELANKHKMQTFLQAGKGYAWIMINYNNLSDENKEIFFLLEKELGEDVIWFVKSNFVDCMNVIRKKLKLKLLTETFDDKYSDEFKKRQILLTYNNNYPRRCVFIRMPISETTTTEDVELYFDKIIARLQRQ